MARTMTVANARNIVERVNDYAKSRGTTQQEAARHLIEVGLMAENDGIYVSELSTAVAAVVREELTSVKAAIRSELRGVTGAIDEKLSAAESASYASLLATLRGDLGEPAPIAADIYTIAGNRYAAGEDMSKALKAAKETRREGERR